jgi:hypothetical protein
MIIGDPRRAPQRPVPLRIMVHRAFTSSTLGRCRYVIFFYTISMSLTAGGNPR